MARILRLQNKTHIHFVLPIYLIIFLLTCCRHLVVLNPYTLLTTLFGDSCWFTVLNLKDSFSCIPQVLGPRNCSLPLNGMIHKLISSLFISLSFLCYHTCKSSHHLFLKLYLVNCSPHLLFVPSDSKCTYCCYLKLSKASLDYCHYCHTEIIIVY